MFDVNDAAMRAIELRTAENSLVFRIPSYSMMYGVQKLPISYVQLQIAIICAIIESSSLN